MSLNIYMPTNQKEIDWCIKNILNGNKNNVFPSSVVNDEEKISSIQKKRTRSVRK